MASERIETLQKARERLVEDRYNLAAGLAKAYEPGKTEEWRKQIVEVQAGIFAIEAAIQDEQGTSDDVGAMIA